MGDRRPIREQETMLPVANRHRVAERSHHGLETPLAAPQRLAQFLQKPLVLMFATWRQLGGIRDHRAIISATATGEPGARRARLG